MTARKGWASIQRILLLRAEDWQRREAYRKEYPKADADDIWALLRALASQRVSNADQGIVLDAVVAVEAGDVHDDWSDNSEVLSRYFRRMPSGRLTYLG